MRIAANSGIHNNDQILSMYTNEAVKCGRCSKQYICIPYHENVHVQVGESY